MCYDATCAPFPNPRVSCILPGPQSSRLTLNHSSLVEPAVKQCHSAEERAPHATACRHRAPPRNRVRGVALHRGTSRDYSQCPTNVTKVAFGHCACGHRRHRAADFYQPWDRIEPTGACSRRRVRLRALSRRLRRLPLSGSTDPEHAPPSLRVISTMLNTARRCNHGTPRLMLSRSPTMKQPLGQRYPAELQRDGWMHFALDDGPNLGQGRRGGFQCRHCNMGTR
jgi:hypothetical protein